MRAPDGDAVAAVPRAAFIDKWFAQEREARLIRVFCAQARAPGADDLGAIEHEWYETVFGASDARVSLGKLAWWDAELGRLAQGQAQHPLARGLHAVAGDACVAPLRSSLRAALGLIEHDSMERGAQLLDALAGVSAGFLQARGLAHDETLARAWAGARLVYELRHWSRFARVERAWLPLDTLARVGYTRQEIAQPGAARAVRDGLLDLADAAMHGAAANADLPGMRMMCARLLSRRLRGVEPGTWVNAPSLRLTFALWRAAQRV
jgi:hypothetical protein